MKCTGIAARWCPNCGDCICPENEDGEPIVLISKAPFIFEFGPKSYVVHDPWCPLHGTESDHAKEI